MRTAHSTIIIAATALTLTGCSHSSPAAHSGASTSVATQSGSPAGTSSSAAASPSSTLNAHQKATPIAPAARVALENPDDIAATPQPAGTGSPDATGSKTHDAENAWYSGQKPQPLKKVNNTTMPANRILIDGAVAYASIIPQGTTNGFLNIPEQSWRVAWQKDSAPLDSATGDTVIAGHSEFNGIPSVLAKLSKVKIGQKIWTTSPSGHLTSWRVSSMSSYTKGALPQFWRDGDRHLQLVTCGGPKGWVKNAAGGRSWLHLDNLVVTAVPSA